MKQLTAYIFEKLRINKDSNKIEYHYHPKDKEELKSLIDQLIKERGEEADLNDIDVSNVTDMNELFSSKKFNGDISKWDVSNVIDMSWLFSTGEFNGEDRKSVV